MNPKIEQIVKTLKDEGRNQEEIDSFLQELTKMASAKLFAEMVANLDEKDLEELDKCSMQEEANFEIRTRFADKTGKSPDAIMEEMLNDIADEFLRNRSKTQ